MFLAIVMSAVLAFFSAVGANRHLALVTPHYRGAASDCVAEVPFALSAVSNVLEEHVLVAAAAFNCVSGTQRAFPILEVLARAVGAVGPDLIALIFFA